MTDFYKVKPSDRCILIAYASCMGNCFRVQFTFDFLNETEDGTIGIVLP